MPIYPYTKVYSIGDDEIATLVVKFPDNGTAGSHLIDIPGQDDFDEFNEFSREIGNGKELKKERTIVFSEIGNMDKNNNYVKADYYINDELIVNHSNEKKEDRSPMIKLTINFIDK